MKRATRRSGRARARLALSLGLIFTYGCATTDARETMRTANAANATNAVNAANAANHAATDEGPREPPPREPEEPFVELAVPGHRPAVVALPAAAEGPQPVLVATHGAGGRPERPCAFWRVVTRGRGFILCPRGVALGTAKREVEQPYFYPNHHALEREVKAALAALKARFGARVDARAPIYAGFSQGAIMGALAFGTRPAVFARMVFIEGGVGEFDEWTIARARHLYDSGAKRVLMACGRLKCLEAARRSARYLERGGLDARVVFGRGAGHSYGGTVAEALLDAFPWLVEGDARWGDDAITTTRP